MLEAPPGAGKTTRVPRALLEAGLGGGREIVVLQPRRLPTRLAARRVAEEMGEKLGDSVGYQVRFEDVGGPRTKLWFVTEGVLGRRLLSEPTLPDVGAVVLDEFHERHLSSDVSLALLRRLQQGRRPDLRLVVMSATLEAAPVSAYLGDCPRIRSEGRRFEVKIDHLAAADPRPVDQQVAAAVKRLAADGLDGDVLVFLPGAAEIRRSREALEDFASRHGLELHALHGDLPPADQDRAVRPGPRRKIILSTNVAETSVTIEGVAAVIDSGLARVASHSPWSGLPVLQLAKVSKASATQRAGRAGRTREGRCLRLYTQHDYEGRPAHDVPEIRRVDLAEMALELRAAGAADLAAFPFFEAPPAAALEAADGLLRRLGAVDAAGKLTSDGQRMLRFPLHPRQSRVVVEAERRGVGQDGAAAAALLGERDIRLEARASVSRSGGRGPSRGGGDSDVVELLHLLRSAEGQGARGLGLDPGAVQAVSRVERQLSRLVRSSPRPPSDEAAEEALMLALLAGYPDRVAKRRRPSSPELILSGGGTATLAETSVVHAAELMAAVDAEERGRAGVVVRLASKVEPEWLLDLFPGELRDVDEHVWNAEAGRVERVRQLLYGQLPLEESRAPAPPSEAAGKVLAAQALSRGIDALPNAEEIRGWMERVRALAAAVPEAGLPEVDDAFVRATIEEACAGLRSLDGLRQVSIPGALTARLSHEQARMLAQFAPERVALPGGRQVRVHYEAGKPPWTESRLQDFFGMQKGPLILKGRVPLVLHLLAPNQRAVQVTTDLAGFWERHYPAIRKELMRKYPRHAWPEDPLHAAPPKPGRPR